MSDSTAAPSGNLAEDAKRLGNEAFAKQAFDEAIAHYSEAIRLDPENAVYYSNRRYVGGVERERGHMYIIDQ
jgi:tetratricopeptide (TPR) repeat protein